MRQSVIGNAAGPLFGQDNTPRIAYPYPINARDTPEGHIRAMHAHDGLFGTTPATSTRCSP